MGDFRIDKVEIEDHFYHFKIYIHDFQVQIKVDLVHVFIGLIIVLLNVLKAINLEDYVHEVMIVSILQGYENISKDLVQMILDEIVVVVILV